MVQPWWSKCTRKRSVYILSEMRACVISLIIANFTTVVFLITAHFKTMVRTTAKPAARGENGHERQTGRGNVHANSGVFEAITAQIENFHTARGYFG